MNPGVFHPLASNSIGSEMSVLPLQTLLSICHVASQLSSVIFNIEIPIQEL